MNEEIRIIPIEQVKVSPFQPRQQFHPDDLEDLAASIRNVGIIHPPLVRMTDDGSYELLAGERRLRASLLAGLKQIPVIVRIASDPISAQAALIENIQRVDLNPLEIAKALKQLMRDLNLSQEELAKRVGKKRSTVANYLRLLQLPKCIQNSIYENKISMGHAKAILSLEEVDKQILLLELILRDDLTVRGAEEAAKRIEDKAKRQGLTYFEKDFFIDFLAEKLQEKLGTKVSIMSRGKAGKIAIDYYNLDDLDRLLSLLGVET